MTLDKVLISLFEGFGAILGAVDRWKISIAGEIFKELSMQKFNLFISLLIMGLLLGSNADAQMMPKIYASGTLIVEEHPITRKDLFDNTFAYMKKREQWRISAFGLERLNRKFSSLGYRFVQVSPGYNRSFPGSFDFYQRDRLLIGGIGNIRGVSLDQQGKPDDKSRLSSQIYEF